MSRAACALLVLVALSGCSGEAPQDPDDGIISEVEEPKPVLLPFAAAGEVTGVGATTPATPHGCSLRDEPGIDQVEHPWTVPGMVGNLSAEVMRLQVTLRWSDPTLVDPDLYLEDVGGRVLGSSIAFNPTTGPSESVTLTQGIGPGDYVIVVRSCAGTGAYTVEGQAMLQPLLPEAPDEPAQG